MLEFYWAYAGYEDMMALTETMLRSLATEVKGETTDEYQGETYDFGQDFRRLTVQEAILSYNPELSSGDLEDLDKLRNVAASMGVEVKETPWCRASCR